MENALRFERSPYLLQHKSNPVDWLPWAEQALNRAKVEDKPILVSVGYAACHWCHVMAEESFGDAKTAALMNALFVNVKVDREERPDVDAFCIRALQTMGKRPGWPLTLFLTPDGKPFWGGTYFPPLERDGLPAFREVLETIHRLYRTDRDTVQARAEDVIAQVAVRPIAGAAAEITRENASAAAEALLGSVDLKLGGLKGQPKFAYAPLLRFLWNTGWRTGRRDFRAAVLVTLDAMLRGGVYDHLGGGFARYAVDSRWLVPHFEKMLYDNAQLISLYAEAWRTERCVAYEHCVRQSVEWLTHELGLPDGGFASSVGAMSEGGEGRFYLWDEAEIDRLLGAHAPLFKRHYGVTREGNFEGLNVLNRIVAPDTAGASEEDALRACRQTLLEARASRPRPPRDEKVLADWNGLAISALTKAGSILSERRWIERAASAFEFVADAMSTDGNLYHAWYEGHVQRVMILDDYAHMARAALSLYEATANARYLAHCEGWVETCASHLRDAASGAFRFSSDYSIAAPMIDGRDSATPSGNGAMAEVYARLYYLTGSERYCEQAEAILRSFAPRVGTDAFELATLLDAAQFLDTGVQVTIVSRDGATAEALWRTALEHALPDSLLRRIELDSAGDGPGAFKLPLSGKPTAYVCVGRTCLQPVIDPGLLEKTLRDAEPRRPQLRAPP